jgi:hypothetical protein
MSIGWDRELQSMLHMGFGQTGQATSSSLLEGFNNCMSQCFISTSICDCFSHLNCSSCLITNHSFLNNSFLSWGVGRQHKFMSIQTWSHCRLWWVSYGYVYNTWPLWNCEKHWHSLFFFCNRSIWTGRSHEGGIVKALNFIISDNLFICLTWDLALSTQRQSSNFSAYVPGISWGERAPRSPQHSISASKYNSEQPKLRFTFVSNGE